MFNSVPPFALELFSKREDVSSVDELRELEQKEASKINEKREKIQTKFEMLEGIHHDLSMTKKTIIIISTHIKDLQKEYDELAPESCPLCGGEMK